MDLKDIRNEIDSVDSELLALFLKRMALVKKGYEYKKKHNMSIFQPDRELDIIASVKEVAGEDMKDFAVDFFAEIMDLSKKYQRDL